MKGLDHISERALVKAKTYANYYKEQEVRVCHLIYSIITDKNGNTATATLDELNIDITLLLTSIEDIRNRFAKTVEERRSKLKLVYSDNLSEIIRRAKQNPIITGTKTEVSVVDLFLSALEVENELSVTFDDFSIDFKSFKEIGYEIEVDQSFDFGESYEYESSDSFTPTTKNLSNIDTIKKYCIDFISLAQEDKITPCFGREEEMNQLYRVLLRKRKSNPMLIGREGVGKTNLVEGLAYNIVQGKVPKKLLNKKVYSLNLNSLISGTKYRGMFEERLEKILEELSSNDDTILFIDEAHTIIGAGSAEGSSDMSNVLKPYISRGGFKIIGATTTVEYKKYIEKDKALKRRFAEILIKEPSIDVTIDILNKLKPYYEKAHGVKYCDDAIRASVILSDKYITYRTLPDKAIDLLDDVAVKNTLKVDRGSKMAHLEKKYREVEKVKKLIIESKCYDNAKEVKKKSKRILNEIKQEQARIKSLEKEAFTITESHIKEVIEEITNIPLTEDGLDISDLEPKLKSKIIGQNEAIERIVETLKINKLALDDDDKPIGSFMFVGYSGVGKTQITKELAKQLFGDEKSIFRVDCSEYTQPIDVNKLIGAPAGYVGYSEGGILTEAIKRQPFSIILFDEIEKAHPKLFDLLLQVLGEGRLTSNMGETIDFKNTIIVLTSNVGTKKAIASKSSIGYSKSENEYDKSIVNSEIIQSFRPEFINRIDNIVHFNVLSQDDLYNILEIELKKLSDKVAKHGVKLNISTPVKRFIVEQGYRPEMGFRPVKRKINDDIKKLIAQQLLQDDVEEINVVLRNNEIKVK